MKKILLLLITSFTAFESIAQTLPVTPEITRAIHRKTRTTSGKPGQNYWQNTASYKLRVKFVPQTRELSGTADIVYTNNSPDTLTKAVFKLYPNLYKKGTVKASKIAASDLTDGVQIRSLSIENIPLSPEIDGTNMTVRIPALLPGKTARFAVDYSYILNKGSHTRTGQVDDGSYFIAYFFPRIAVYDDIDGWNMYPYRGSEEFYNDFCSFDAEISMPAKYVVWATGNLSNSSEVFQPGIIDRIAKAETSDSVTNVIDAADLEKAAVTLPGDHIWKFLANNVTDFVFATSDHYIWKSSSLIVDPESKRRTRVDAVFNPDHKDYYEIIDFARKTVETMSYTFPKWPYPYPHETIFDGLDQMEYPMMVNDNPTRTREDAITLTDHEIFHTMFPFYMGVNETKHGWMDEGWATIGEWIISAVIDPSYTDTYGVEPYARTAGTAGDQPIISLTTDQKGAGEFTNSYPKPAMGYLYVKDLLGDELFTKALHNYIKLWNGKHPVPSDFFNSMNAGAGKNLDWFWKRWFFDAGLPNLAIMDVVQKGNQYTITVENKGGKPLPVDLIVNYTDGTSERLHRSVGVWEKGDTVVALNVKTPKIVKDILLGSTYVPDSDKKDNTWTAVN